MRLSGLRALRGPIGAALVIGLAVTQGSVAGQAPKTPKAPVAAAKTFKVRVKQNGINFVTVRAKEVPLKQIAAELSRRIKAPVVLSPVMAKQVVTLEFDDLPLEAALQLMAPLPSVHYELQGGTTPVCREIFLNAYNESPPFPAFDGKNIMFVVEGDTESTDGQDDSLRVSYNKGRLSVKAKKQSLPEVLNRIAIVLGINFQMTQDTDATIDVEFK
jgi:hypothetical protein